MTLFSGLFVSLGAVALAEYIADTRTLLRLDIRENDLFVGGLMALTLAVKINETVVRIDLDKDLKKEQVSRHRNKQYNWQYTYVQALYIVHPLSYIYIYKLRRVN